MIYQYQSEEMNEIKRHSSRANISEVIPDLDSTGWTGIDS